MPTKPSKNYLAPAVFYALALTIFSLSLQDDWDLEIFVSQTTHTLVGKVSKEQKENNGGHGEIALAAARASWTPSFDSLRLAIAEPADVPHLLLIRTVAIRAPPVRPSL